MKRKLIIIGLIIVALLAVGIIKDQIIKSAVTVVASQVTGAPVHIDGFSLGIFSQSVRITGFKMYNPQGFPKDILIDLSEISVKYDLGALLKKKLHLVRAEIELKEMALIKNKDGKMNVDELKVVKEAKAKDAKGAKPSEQMPMQIDELKLGIGKIILKDYSAKEAVLNVHDINIHKEYKNITSAQQLVALVLAEPMKAAGIQGAKIYGVAMLAGAAVLPVAIAATFVSKDSVNQEFTANVDNVYKVSLEVLKTMGKVTKEDKAGGRIDADVSSAQVALKIKVNENKKTGIAISARKYLLPKREIAAGVLYEISKKIK